MTTIEERIPRQDAPALRELLAIQKARGVTYVEKAGFIGVSFVIEGPAEVMPIVKRAIDDWGAHLQQDRAW